MVGMWTWRERAAARWLARMGNEGEAFDRAAFERWRARRANARAFDEAAADWGRDLPIAATSYAQARQPVGSRPAPRHRIIAALAAVVIATIAVTGFWHAGLIGDGAVPPARGGATRISTGPGEVRAFTLNDGSIATLGARSDLAIVFADDGRRLTLRRGHARFDVAHDASRPFEVRAGQSLVTAHGTAFDIRLDAHGTRIALMRGAIDVERLQGIARSGEIRRLTPGQQVTIPPTGPIGPVERAAADQPPAMLSFDRTPLRDAVASFNRRNGRRIVLSQDQSSGETVSGGFVATDPDGFAQMLASMFDLILTRRPNGDLVLAPARRASPPEK